MNRVRKQMRFPDMKDNSLTGKDVLVAILDSGIAQHPDFNGKIIGFRDFINERNNVYDDYGHGTHVAGILAGDGMASKGLYAGIAPQAKLIVGKVLDEKGSGDTDCLIKALEWVMEQSEILPIRILNISISLEEVSKGSKARIQNNLSKISDMLSILWKRGVFVAVAAGNGGPEEYSLSKIGMETMVMCIGCHDEDYIPHHANKCEMYSGRGPGLRDIKKPDLVAPGTEIISCNSHFILKHGIYRNAYIAKSGTSMATPIVSGCAALYFEKYPTKTNVDVKTKMLHTAKNLGEQWTKQGWGMLNPQRVLA